MASVFSYYVACLHSSGDRNGQLTQPPLANHGVHSPHPIPDSQFEGRTDPPAHSYDSAASYPQRTSPFHGTAANDADASMRKPRRLL